MWFAKFYSFFENYIRQIVLPEIIQSSTLSFGLFDISFHFIERIYNHVSYTFCHFHFENSIYSASWIQKKTLIRRMIETAENSYRFLHIMRNESLANNNNGTYRGEERLLKPPTWWAWVNGWRIWCGETGKWKNAAKWYDGQNVVESHDHQLTERKRQLGKE